MKKILIINGPNLNMLGKREPEIYGSETLADIESMCQEAASEKNITIDFRQSNSEGEIIGWIQQAIENIDGLIINAAAYTHTSIAIHDALKLLNIPIIEVHMSNPKERESFRHTSYIEALASTVITGKGAKGYTEAISLLSDHINM
jgi:3-dehydroquinate dehydratase-2